MFLFVPSFSYVYYKHPPNFNKLWNNVNFFPESLEVKIAFSFVETSLIWSYLWDVWNNSHFIISLHTYSTTLHVNVMHWNILRCLPPLLNIYTIYLSFLSYLVEYQTSKILVLSAPMQLPKNFLILFIYNNKSIKSQSIYMNNSTP